MNGLSFSFFLHFSDISFIKSEKYRVNRGTYWVQNLMVTLGRGNGAASPLLPPPAPLLLSFEISAMMILDSQEDLRMK